MSNLTPSGCAILHSRANCGQARPGGDRNLPPPSLELTIFPNNVLQTAPRKGFVISASRGGLGEVASNKANLRAWEVNRPRLQGAR